MDLSKRTNENGNVFLILFGAVAVLGILGVGVTNFMKGPLTSAVKLTRSNTAQTQMMMASQSAVMAAANLGSSGDCDGDGFIEPLEWRIDATKPKPTGGNLLPSNIGAPTVDPWGTDYGYCVWDHGTSQLGVACQQNTPGSNARLEGYNGKSYPVVAVISAGPDKQFATTCRNFTTGATRADQNSNGTLEDSGDFPLVAKDSTSSDDLIFSYTYEEASGASGGLWVLKSSDANTAIIDKAIEANQAKFTGTSMVASIGASQGNSVGCAGLGEAYYDDVASGHCYFRTAASTTWAAGKTSCEASSGYLASITSVEENNLVFSKLSAAAALYIGGSDAGVEGEWRWSGGQESGQQFWSGQRPNLGGYAVGGSYSNWQSSHPDSSGFAAEDYLILNTSGTWNDDDGVTARKSICEKASVTPADCSGLGAAYYNDASTGHCYYKSSSGLNWDNAKAACQANSGYLVTISSSAENALLAANLALPAVAWIGANDAAVEGEWRWIGGELAGQQFWSGNNTGAAVGSLYSNWSPTYSAPTTDAGKNCASIDNPGYKWHDGTCSSNITYICEKTPLSNDLEMTSGLKLADDTVMVNCNTANTGVLRRNATGAMQMCDGSSWVMQGAATGIDDLSDGIANYVKGNIFAGVNNGNLTLTGLYNTAIGVNAATFLTSGTSNTGMGYYALRNTTSGSYNTAIGSKSMQSSSGGSYNAAVGYLSCGSVGAAGNTNTCVGSSTVSSTTATDITAIGQGALRSNTGATYNTAIGGGAMVLTTTGYNNTAIGYNVLAQNLTGNNNTGIGYNAGSKILNDGTTAVGYNALLNAKYPGGLTAFGYLALFTQPSTTASNTVTGITAIGTQAMYLENSSGSISYSTALGYQAMYSNTDSGGDVALGSGALYGNLSNNAYNTAIGKSAMSLKTGGTQNVAVGTNAFNTSGSGDANVAVGLYALTSATVNGLTAVGYHALYSNTTGAQNTAVGYQALEVNTTGSQNTAVGYQAMLSGTSPTTSTAIGYQALKINVSSAANTAVGTESMPAVTAGSNTAFGYRTMYLSVNASNNTAFGANVLSANITGGNNVGVGKDALLAMTDSNGTAVGKQAMAGNTSGLNNTAFGSEALLTNTTAAGNTAVGYQALNLMTAGAAGNTAVGYQAGAAANTSVPNELAALGSSAANLTKANGVTAVGMNALKTNGTGANATAVGYGAAGFVPTTTGTVAIGYQALGLTNSNIGGSIAVGALSLANATLNADTNTAIGYKASYARTNAVTGTSIGALAGSTGNYANATAIGYGAQVTAANTIRLGDTNITTIEGQVAFTATSDARVKKDIQPSDLGLDFIMHLKPVSYRLKQGNGRLDYGFLAQDIEASLDGRLTNMITRREDEMRTYQLRSNDLIAPLVKAVQERQKKIEDLKRQIVELKQPSAPSCREEMR